MGSNPEESHVAYDEMLPELVARIEAIEVSQQKLKIQKIQELQKKRIRRNLWHKLKWHHECLAEARLSQSTIKFNHLKQDLKGAENHLKYLDDLKTQVKAEPNWGTVDAYGFSAES